MIACAPHCMDMAMRGHSCCRARATRMLVNMASTRAYGLRKAPGKSLFSPPRERFGGFAHARTFAVQESSLVAMRACCNLAA